MLQAEEEEGTAMKQNQKSGKYGKGIIECDYCGQLFVEGEPFCPCCGKPVEEMIADRQDSDKKGTGTGRSCFGK